MQSDFASNLRPLRHRGVMVVCRLVLLAILCFGVCRRLPAAVAVGEDALVLTVESVGPDCYADGTAAVDDEYYALVSVAAGEQFAGFAADGKLVDERNSRLLCKLPIASGGRCPKTNVAVDGAEIRSGERLLLVLLDTRATARTGASFRVDGWAEAGTVEHPAAGGFAALAGESASAMVRSAVPADAPRPRITAIRRDGAVVVLTVADTLNVLDYNVAAGASPACLDECGAAVQPVAGTPDGEIELHVVVGEEADQRFFKIVRDGGVQ